jgi:glycosyltransferase involved in cell wall biosynthesis
VKTASPTPKPLRLAVAIITLDEEANLARCLETVRDLAAEIVVVDSGSKDRTGEIARQFGAKFEFHPWQGYIGQKNIALRSCSQPWVLCLDADEALSPELVTSIREQFTNGEPAMNGFWVNRRTFYLGKWIWHAWYPEWRLRLVRKQFAEWGGLDPHDKLEVDGRSARLQGDLLHYPFREFQEHLSSEIKHARTMADSYLREGKAFRWHQLLVLPWFAFFKRLVLKQGWRDGWRGWIIAFIGMVGTFTKYSFLWEKQHADSTSRSP